MHTEFIQIEYMCVHFQHSNVSVMLFLNTSLYFVYPPIYLFTSSFKDVWRLFTLLVVNWMLQDINTKKANKNTYTNTSVGGSHARHSQKNKQTNMGLERL